MVTWAMDENAVHARGEESEGEMSGEDDSISPDDLLPDVDADDLLFFFSTDDLVELARSNAPEGAKKPPKASNWEPLCGSDQPKVSIDGGKESVLKATAEEINCLYDSYSSEFDERLDFEFFCRRTFGPESKLAAHFRVEYDIPHDIYCRFLATLFVTCRFNDILSNLIKSKHFVTTGLMKLDDYNAM